MRASPEAQTCSGTASTFGTRMMGTINEGPDFLSAAGRQMAEAQSLGAVFDPEGAWTMSMGRAPLPSALTDRLRVHRKAIAALVAEKTA